VVNIRSIGLSRSFIIAGLAFMLLPLGCGSSSNAAGGAGSTPDAAPGTGTPPPSGSCSVAAIPANNAVFNLLPNFSVDATGIAFATLTNPMPADGSPGIIGSSGFSGPVTTLYELPKGAFPGQLPSDDKDVYFSFSGFQVVPSSGLYSVPHTGTTSTPTPVFVPPNNQGIYTFTTDANTIYVSSQDSSDHSVIYAIPKNNVGAPAAIYTTPQVISYLFSDGSSLWWTEEAQIYPQSATDIRTAPIAATLAPTTFATVQPPLILNDLFAANGIVAFPYFSGVNLGDGGIGVAFGLYTITRNGTPTLVDPGGFIPVFMGPGDALYYPSLGGLTTVTLGASGASAPKVLVSNAGVLGVGVGPGGTVYYATPTCIDKK
jgi:hypothetical protein